MAIVSEATKEARKIREKFLDDTTGARSGRIKLSWRQRRRVFLIEFPKLGRNRGITLSDGTDKRGWSQLDAKAASEGRAIAFIRWINQPHWLLDNVDFLNATAGELLHLHRTQMDSTGAA